MAKAIPCWQKMMKACKGHAGMKCKTVQHVPAATVGQERAGATHTFFRQRPYVQSVPVVQLLPTAPPVLCPAVAI